MPKKPKLPPGLFNLKARRIWLSHFRPTFTYGDERDKLQAKQLRAEKRQLARDEAWARHAKRKQQKVAQKQERLERKRAGGKPSGKGFKPLADSKKVNSSSKPPTIQPRTVQGWAALQVKATTTAPSKRPNVARSPSLPTARPVYASPSPASPVQYVRSASLGHGHRAKPGMPSSQQAHRAHRPVVAQPVRSATQPVPVRRTTATAPAAAPRVVRSNTQPLPSKKRL